MVVALAVAISFLVLPVLAILTHSPPRRLVQALGDPASREALKLSLETTLAALALIVVIGTPAAFLLASRSFPGRALLITLIELPLVLPPAVAGIGLLAALGPRGILGGALRTSGVQLVLQSAGVIVAVAFVSAPLYLRQAQASFQGVEKGLLDAARTLGCAEAGAFLRVAVPVAMPSLLAGAALAWARALGEFGATLMFAGSYRGVTQTVPLAIYDRFATDFPGALGLSAILVAVSAALLLVVKLAAAPRSFVIARS
jgi:molybdate transport system permease protein